MFLVNIFESPGVVGAIAGALGALAFFAYGYARKIQIRKGHEMGLDFDQTSCPNCGQELPRVRRPANLRQTLWGGWTCSSRGKK